MAYYPLVRNAKVALIWLIAYALVLWVFSFIPPLFAALCLLSPILLAYFGVQSGLIPLGISALLTTAAAWLTSGNLLIPTLTMVYLWPFLIVHAFCFYRKLPFWQAAAMHVAVLAISITGILTIIRPYLGGDLFIGGAAYLVQQISQSTYGDQFLLQLYQMGLLSVPTEMLENSVSLKDTLLRGTAGIVSNLQNMLRSNGDTPPEWMSAFVSNVSTSLFSEPLRNELLNGLRRLMQTTLYSFIPSAIVNTSLLMGTFGVAFPATALRRKKQPVITLMPFSAWHLSKGAGWKVMLLGFGYMLPILFTNPNTIMSGSFNPWLLLAGNMMSAAFSTVFTIQGAALIDFFQLRTGKNSSLRRVWICLLYVAFPQLLLLMGIADQFINIRGLRKTHNKEEV